MTAVPNETQAGTLDFTSVAVRGLPVFKSIIDAGTQSGIDPTGTNDSTAAIQAALNAAPANGSGHGIVFLPPGRFKVTSALLPPDGVALIGSGRGITTLVTANNPAIHINVIPANFYQTGFTLANITVDCSAQTQGGARGGLYASAQNGLDLQGVNHLLVENVNVLNPSGYGITIGGGGYGTQVADVRLRNIRVVGEWNGYDAIGGGAINGGYIENYQSIDNAGSASDLVWVNNFTWRKVSVTQPTYGFTNGPIGIGTDSGASNVVIDDLSVDSCKYGILISGVANSGAAGAAPYNIHISKLRATNCGSGIFFNCTSGKYPTYVTLCDFIITGFNKGNNGTQAIQLQGGQHIVFKDGIVGAPAFGTPYAISLQADGGGNPVSDTLVSDVIMRGTGGVQFSSVSTDGSVIVRNCPGWNPLGGAGTQPAVPASGTTYTNVNNADATVYVSGGTMTSPTIVGGKSTGFTTGTFRVPAGGTIELFYSAAPSWAWVYD